MIESERIEDSPFIGALISAIDCKFKCNNCFNQDLKNLNTIENEPDQIIREVNKNSFNKGIIFGGLEWTLQKEELIELASKAKKNGLLTMLYTGNSFEDIETFVLNYGEYFDYIKCGKYKEDNKTINHLEYGVTLASGNQHIYKQGIDY